MTVNKLILYASLYNICQVMADGLPANPPPVPATTSWISVAPESYALPAFNQQFLSTPAAESDEIQIGNSFFESGGVAVHSIRQVGIAVEERPNMADTYIYFNQLLSNNIFYEIRGYAGYNYQSAFHPSFQSLPVSNQTLPLGYGFVGNLGYVIPLNNNVTLMPFLRLSYYNDYGVIYSNSNGDSFGSDTYMVQLGARISLKINPVFALYASYYGGYQDVMLINGSGVYSGIANAQIQGYASTLEFGLPYKMTKSWSLIPYMQFNTNAVGPNSIAASSPYNARTITFTSNTYALKLSYDF